MSPGLLDSKGGTGAHACGEQQERKQMGPGASTWGSATWTSHFLSFASVLSSSSLGNTMSAMVPWFSQSNGFLL